MVIVAADTIAGTGAIEANGGNGTATGAGGGGGGGVVIVISTTSHFSTRSHLHPQGLPVSASAGNTFPGCGATAADGTTEWLS